MNEEIRNGVTPRIMLQPRKSEMRMFLDRLSTMVGRLHAENARLRAQVDSMVSLPLVLIGNGVALLVGMLIGATLW